MKLLPYLSLFLTPISTHARLLESEDLTPYLESKDLTTIPCPSTFTLVKRAYGQVYVAEPSSVSCDDWGSTFLLAFKQAEDIVPDFDCSDDEKRSAANQFMELTENLAASLPSDCDQIVASMPESVGAENSHAFLIDIISFCTELAFPEDPDAETSQSANTMCDDLMQDSVQGTEEIFLANAILGECPIPGVFMCSKVVEEFEDYFKGLFAPDSSSEDMDERDIGPVNHNDDTSSTSSSDDINNIDGGGGSPDLPPPDPNASANNNSPTINDIDADKPSLPDPEEEEDLDDELNSWKIAAYFVAVFSVVLLLTVVYYLHHTGRLKTGIRGGEHRQIPMTLSEDENDLELTTKNSTGLDSLSGKGIV